MNLDRYEDVKYRDLNFLTAYINYGGRVTDYIDLRTIDVIMSDFYRPEVLEPGHRFDKDGVYISIQFDPEDPHKSYKEYIDQLPISAGPQVFGLHDNANIACAEVETFGMFQTLLSLQSKAGGGASSARDELIDNSATSIAERLAERGAFDIEAMRLQYPVMYEESMNTVLVQEAIRYNKLVDEMQRSLPLLRAALKGLVVLSSELEAMGNRMAVNEVPENWEKAAYPSMMPLESWATDLMSRLDFINNWIEFNYPPVFWVSGFYFPQAFLTGVQQNYARKKQFPIDTISFDFFVMDLPWEDYMKKPEDGAYIRGLFIEGARWDPTMKSINDSIPKQLFSAMPVIHLSPVKDRTLPKTGIYQMPVYKILSRRGVLSTTGHSTNFICWIEIPSNRTSFKPPAYINQEGKADQEDWIKAGVACFGSLKYV